MKKVSLKNIEVLNLDGELNGFITQNGEQVSGLLNEEIPVKVRFWASRVNSKIDDIKKSFNEAREELIKKYGEETDGVVSVPKTIKEGKKEIINPNFVKFQEEFIPLNLMEEEFEVPELSIDELGNFNTKINLNVLFKLID